MKTISLPHRRVVRELPARKATSAARTDAAGPAIKLRRILVPVDFSPESKVALEQALVYARHYGAKIHFLHVARPIPYEADYGYGPVTVQLPDEAHERRTKIRLAAWVEKMAAPAFIGEVIVRTGDASEEIIQAAKELHIDLIVLSPRTGAALAQPGKECVAEHVIRHAACSVLSVWSHGTKPSSG